MSRNGMKRDLPAVAGTVYDVAIIGGGIYGATIAWEAALRGLRVCLIEKSDFGSGTSANSLKIIHGGLRYLQHGDLKRMRESIQEQRTLMRIAPHLVHALPILIPTYGHGLRGKEVLALAIRVNEIVGFDYRSRPYSNPCLPRARVVGRDEVLSLLPGIEPDGLTGGVVFYDAQAYNSERLLLSFVISAANTGADIANYVEVTGCLGKNGRVDGLKARDVLGGEEFDLRARTVVNACGPWVGRLNELLRVDRPAHPTRFVKAINLVTRPLFEKYAVGVYGLDSYRDADAVLNKGSRLLFITPWRERSVVGTAYVPCDDDPDQVKVSAEDIRHFVKAINQAYPLANLKRKDILFIHCGLVPASSAGGQCGSIQLAKHFKILGYHDLGVKNLIAVLGVKYTTARAVAAKVVDQVFQSWGQKPKKTLSMLPSLYGGQMQDFDAFMDDQIRERPYGLGEETIRRLVLNYGSAYPQVLQHLDSGEGPVAPVGEFAVRKAEVRHAVRAEMAYKLSDVILRRTEWGTAGYPGNEVLQNAADVMAEELRWSPTKVAQELGEVNQRFAIGQ